MNHNICAGIVLYNPEISLLKENIDSIFNQSIDCIYIFDNASENYDDIIVLIKKYNNVIYERGAKNFGIAYALNKILEFAKNNNYEWFLTLDQDSICNQNMIQEYCRYLNYKNVAIICPFILNNGKRTVRELQNLNLPEYQFIDNPVDCITSASLNNTTIIDKIGAFNQNMFIDYVDTELNCRILSNNYKILQVNKTFLYQKMGQAKPIRLFDLLYRITNIDVFRKMKVASVYSDLRLYYMSRNSAVVRKIHKNHGYKLSFLYMFCLFCYFSLTYPLDRNRISIWKKFICGTYDACEFIKNNYKTI